jgi:hypothetical protein
MNLFFFSKEERDSLKEEIQPPNKLLNINKIAFSTAFKEEI